MNTIIITGNLVNDIATNVRNDKLYAYDKIGVYNGKDKNGNQRDSMFFDFIVFGRDAELLRDMAKKGDQVTLIGRLEEDKNEIIILIICFIFFFIRRKIEYNINKNQRSMP